MKLELTVVEEGSRGGSIGLDRERASKRLLWASNDSGGQRSSESRKGKNGNALPKNLNKGSGSFEEKQKTTQKIPKRMEVPVVEDEDSKVKTSEKVKTLNSFKELCSQALVNALGKEYTVPTIIQKYCIPSMVEGRNLICRAPTGMGKTMCFLIPIIERYKQMKKPQACIISPTRELCEQIRTETSKLVYGSKIRVVSIYGKKQDLPSYAGVDIIVATPGRLIDLLHKGRVDLSEIKMFVLDEADKLLDMGFEVPIKEIHKYIPKNTQTCLFSATYSPKLTRMINYFLPEDKVSVEIPSETLRNIKQEIVEVRNKKKALLSILQNSDINLKGSWRMEVQPDKVLVFVERKSECGEVEKVLKKSGVLCVTLHGDKEQSDRNEALKGFRNGRFPVMVATSVAARGIDIKDIKLVINYDIPRDIKEYIHRIGRTGREGKSGKSISFYDGGVSADFKKALIEVLRESKNPVPSFLSDVAEDFDAKLQRLKISADKETSDDEEVGLWGDVSLG
ncbi:DEAD box ATP-dependent RNA helicase [Encephalitozoon romaleae SJ-2008]|uniref:RNA helicase n=1 Tax=Encephalitozoon romaleae (strain SJ-2008) TaxID=1178016 RepID=I7ALI1_ENCRO|nr:DEAD box ATP-dependent RNA helicase [Encephalitozoon romaleae SJ-2008]AFN82534.1 DEAD box ATP-dependent RNA helicase [Encephalitozoon romaleae SJ-2008]